MKILFVTTISNTVNAFLIPHIEMLISHGNRVDVAFNIEQEVKPEVYELGCKVHIVGFQRSPLNRNNYAAYKKLREIILYEKYDLIHTHTPVASACVRIACRNLKFVKVFYTAHGFHFYKGAPIKNWIIYYPIEKWLSKYTDVLITINQEDFEFAKSKLKAKDVKQINGIGIDLKRFRPRSAELKKQMRNSYGYPDDEFILVCIGELNHNKHQDMLIKAISLLTAKMPKIKLLLAGIGICENQYKLLANKLNVERNIEFLGYRRDIENLILATDLAVSSSRREGLPVNVMEAMASGLPLVATDCRGNRDLVKNGVNGYLVKTDDAAGMADSIEKVLQSAMIRERFSRNSLETIKKYSLDRVKEDLEGLYLSYLGK